MSTETRVISDVIVVCTYGGRWIGCVQLPTRHNPHYRGMLYGRGETADMSDLAGACDRIRALYVLNYIVG